LDFEEGSIKAKRPLEPSWAIPPIAVGFLRKLPLSTIRRAGAQSVSTRAFTRERDSYAAETVSALGIRPLPPHLVQRAGYILRPGCDGCFTGGNPVPAHAGRSRSFELVFFISTPAQKKSPVNDYHAQAATQNPFRT
jgi:hypothetical protein